MTKKIDLSFFREKGLWPLQVQLAENFLLNEEERYWEVVAPTGIGKTYLGAALIAHEFKKGLNERFLIIAPSLLLLQWQSLLSSFAPQCNAVIFDRKTYLEYESKVPIGESPWPLTNVILLSLDFAKRDDIVLKLIEEKWALVIFDESHLLTVGQRKALLYRFIKSGAIHRALLLTQIEKEFPGLSIHRVNITLSEIMDWKGQPLFTSFDKKLTLIYYTRTEEEKQFLTELQKFAEKIRAPHILRAASSSLFTIERVLFSLKDLWMFLRNKIAHNIPWADEDLDRIQRHLSLISDELVTFEDFLEDKRIQPTEFISLYNKLESLLLLIEEIPKDTKLEALISYINESYKIKDIFHICILSSYASTVHYISSSLQEIETPIFTITSSLELKEIKDNIELFQKKGGILITSDAIIRDETLEYVDECINYDFPMDINNFEQRWGSFFRVGRKGEFRMVIFRDQTKAFEWEDNLIKKIESTISS